MDFVVVGLGIGALAVLLGLAIRDLGPFVRRVPRDGWMPWADVADRVAWGGRCRATGLVVALAGGGVCVVTGVALLARVSDGSGMWIVLGAITLAIVSVAAWAVWFQMMQSAWRAATRPVDDAAAWTPRTPAPGEATERPPRQSALASIRNRSRGVRPRERPSPDDVPQVVPDNQPVQPIAAAPDPNEKVSPAGGHPADSAPDLRPPTSAIPRVAKGPIGAVRGQGAPGTRSASGGSDPS